MPLKHSGASLHAAQKVFFLGMPAVIGKSPFKSFTRGNGWQRGTFVRSTEGQSPHLEMKPEYHLRVSLVQFYGLSYITQNSKKELCTK